MLRKLLAKLADHLPARIIADGNREYMIRFYLATLLGRRYYLHLFLGSDPDRGIHNHPWKSAWSFILAGWYFEELRGPTKSGGRRTRKVSWFNRLTGDTCHRIVLPSTKPVWTLFSHSVGDVQEWGFFTRIKPAGTKVIVANDRGELIDNKHHVREIYEPFQYPGGVKKVEWWKDACSGKSIRYNQRNGKDWNANN